MNSVNVCRFIGRLTKFEVRTSADGNYFFGKGSLQLVSEEGKGCQYIELMAWEETARRLEEVVVGTWIEVLTYYSPSEYKGRLQAVFTIDAFRVVKNG